MIYSKFSKNGFFGLLIFKESLQLSSTELSLVEFLNKYNNSFSTLITSLLALSLLKSFSISSKDISSKSNLGFFLWFFLNSFLFSSLALKLFLK